MDVRKLHTLQHLVSLHIDGDLDKDGLEQLSQLLSSNAEATEAYVNLLTTHSDMTLLIPGDQREVSSSDIGGTISYSPNHLPQRESLQRSSRSSWTRYVLVGIAASLLTFVASQGLLTRNSQSITDSTSAGEASVARIIRKVDCDWEGDRWEVVSSSQILPGQTLTMARGLMELEFNSGARITLEAPVSFTVESAMRGVLSHGKLTAQVPDSAHGFSVSTPKGEMVDLGTEFGLFVGEDGVTETHVFTGEVVVHPAGVENAESGISDSSSTVKELSLTEDMALRLGGAQDKTNSIAAVPGRFTRLAFEDDKVAPIPAVDRKLSLWFSADQRLQKDEAGRISAWGDLCTMSNQTAQNAWQVNETKRPLWVEDAIGNKPALRFARKNQLVTEPIKLGAAQTIAIVFRLNLPLLDKWGVGRDGRQLINLNGPPHLLLRVNKKRLLISRNYTGFQANDAGKRNYVSVGRTTSPRELGEKPVVAISVYDPSIDSSRLYMNNVLVDKAKAPELEPTKSPRSIGSHPFLPNTHFFGDIAELMIYDTGLTDEESLALCQSLMEKYRVNLEPSGG